MNKVTIFGNITHDITTSSTPSGKTVAKFTIAVNNGKDADGKERPADFINCVAWNKSAETIGRFCGKGSKILIEGKFKTDVYEDKKYPDVKHYNSYVLVDSFEFGGGKSNGGNTQQTTQAESVTETSSEDCPF